jgi:hypothetical protein
MSIKFTEIQNSVERKRVKELYCRSIPPHEKSYFYLLWWKRKRPIVSFVNIYDEDKWVGFTFYSLYKDLVYMWFFAIDDTTRSKEYESTMFSEIKRLHPNCDIIWTIEAENENGENIEQANKRKQSCEENGFRETGYFVKRKTDSFEIMFTGEAFNIGDFYDINKGVYPFIGVFIVKSHKKQIQKK